LYIPAVDWRFYKAQLYQESRLDPQAVSPVGARGLAQFMPATWEETSQQLGFNDATPHQAEYAILAGAYYMAKLRASWSAPRPEMDKHSLALASYNAGFGNILKAQRLCLGVARYAEIVRCLPEVTGQHSKETIEYVKRVWKYGILQVVGG